MSSQIINGKSISSQIKNEIKNRIKKLSLQPGLAVIIVGNRIDSQTYVNMKKKSCKEVGIQSFTFELPEKIEEINLINLIHELNQNSKVHGILVQLPLPQHINEFQVINSISSKKDVDGFTHNNIGKLTLKHDLNMIPCTPEGCIEILDRINYKIEGKHAVIVGRSNIVGLPLALLLLHRNATITICHSRTVDIIDKVKQGDIIIAACGKPKMIKKEWVKKGAVVIDVGINSIEDINYKSGYKLVGDVDFENVKEIASYITPVPGGVGPLTIAMLLKKTVFLCEKYN